ncbi:hypothetical protein [Pelagovum pacificum]|uniref:Arginine transporter n=1 Tax=Pelagovum pacificum TaxID=2588711 RepID=A0A5C5GEE0_9RHOB|nr:hypothetical protein [Pelagovum pacificum]QQA43727.1 hypothetical protein I8N54_03885 [Pelagovum pacificum]TNY33142.1 hypothetical protein FHY64_07650 [Pelagovum pacificum]
MKRLILVVAILAVASCGGERGSTGPVANACMASDRGNNNAALCGCVQRAAHQTLNRSEQRETARYFSDPERLQRMKLDDRPHADEAWRRYSRFIDTAESMCS